MAKNGKLNDRQQCFVREYLIDLNATQAAIRAGYSSKSAEQQGSRMLRNVKVAEAISREMAERSKRTGISQDRVVEELAKIAFVKMTDIIDRESGQIREDANDEDLACVESMKIRHTSTAEAEFDEHEIKISSKLKALELLGKHLGMWNDKIDVNVAVPVVISGEETLED